MSPFNATASTSGAPDATAIEDHLVQDIAACTALLQLMQAEREALQARDTDALGQAINAKVTHLERLEQSAALRAHWASQAQAANQEDAWHQLLHDLKQPALHQLWEQLKQLVSECRDQNETNGKLLARSQHTFGRLMAVMRGQTEAPALYNPKGTRSAGSSSQTFGEA